jgi:hypothetical protein
MPGGVIIKKLDTAQAHISATFLERLAEWTFAAILTSWGLMLLRPEDSFGLSVSQATLARIASEEAWGYYCLTVGGSRLAALFINGWVVPHTYFVRSATSFLSLLAWLTISLGLMASGTASTGLAIYPWIFLAELICLYRTGRDYKAYRMVQAAEA